MKILTIPDCHVEQAQDLTRFLALGKYIAHTQPDVIITMGDFLSMKAISHWDRSKKLSMEGKRYAEDLAAANRALDLLDGPSRELRANQKRVRVKQYRPTKIFLEGNHEEWERKFLEENPSMSGHIDYKESLHLRDREWDSMPYKEFVEFDGILFTHVPLDGSKQPIRGASICHSALRYVSKSIVFGHTHRWEMVSCKRHGDSDIIQALTSGCFFEGEDDFMKGGANHYWNGVTLLDTWGNGRFDVQQVSKERLLHGYIT